MQVGLCYVSVHFYSTILACVINWEEQLKMVLTNIIIIIHYFQSDASPEELEGRCSVTVFSLWLWPVTRTAERPDKQVVRNNRVNSGPVGLLLTVYYPTTNPKP